MSVSSVYQDFGYRIDTMHQDRVGRSESHCSVNVQLAMLHQYLRTCVRAGGRRFEQSFVKSLFQDMSANLYRNKFIFDRHAAKEKLAIF